MKRDRNQPTPDEAAALRRRADMRLKTVTPAARTEVETQQLLHELQVYQVELELQNDELRQAREEAEKLLEQYTELYDFAPVGYATLDREGTMRAVNLTGAGLLGVARGQLIGRDFGGFVAVAARPTFSAFLEKVFASGSREACEVALRQDGTLPHFVQLEAVAAASGQECRVALIDISRRRQLESQVEKQQAELAVRAAELAAANIELEAFNYTVSHDLRTPLTIIHGYSQVLREVCGELLPEPANACLREMQEGTLRMNRLLDTLLEFSRSAHIDMHKEQIDLSRLAEQVVQDLRLNKPEDRADFRIAPGIVAQGDPDLLRVVLVNLIGNARKFSGGREQPPLIEFGEQEADGKPACYVRDNGPGFAMADAERLFYPFQRLPGTEAKGHGIGLATVDRIVRRHDGRVWAESAPGQGATFFFTLESLERRLP